MAYGVKLWVRGEFACFTRPELKSERVSYDVMTPSAARGILEAIHWKPAIRWVIDRIHVLEPIKFQTFRRNEVGTKIPTGAARTAMNRDTLVGLGIAIDENRQQRQTIALRDVAYVIEAHFEMTEKAEGDTPAKHYEMFKRRAAKGQCFHRPCLGCREFVADFELVEGDVPTSKLEGPNDLGWMLYDIDFENDKLPKFFRAKLQDGVLDVAAAREEGLIS
ncbi:MAG: type I-C CRISPR-associated protein Cas5c [Alphaproteobacteria bacterium]|nr:type I-C CRISPR-associated protein Cas5c [Alphaproteobacteria bacterium]